MDTKQQRYDWHAAIYASRRCDSIDPSSIAMWGSSYSGGHVIDAASTELLIAAVRDALRGMLHRPPYLVPVYGSPGEVAQFRDPALKAFFDALVRESSTWRNAFAPRILLKASRYRAGTTAQLTMPLLVCVVTSMSTHLHHLR